MAYFPVDLGGGAQLRIFSLDDTRALFTLLSQNSAHLDRWVTWTRRIQTVADLSHYLGRFAQKWAYGDGFHAGIWLGEALAGGIACRYIDRESRKSEIGYWLIQSYVGRGLATAGARAALRYLFEVENLHRVEIQCAVENAPSRAVAERLGFRLEGVLRDAVWLADHFADHAVYSLLEDEWRSGSSPSAG